ncbi:unnamed protein product [Arabidopsis lyrata]|nr:unnamed protein product [Arabidopsis lyrata]
MAQKPRTVICVGDIHGYISKLNNLWLNPQSAIDPSEFSSALVIFLGDYCDRGPETGKVIDFLISLPEKHPDQTHVFLAGNHDFAFSGFLGLLPRPSDGSDLKDTWKEYEGSEEREGWVRFTMLDRLLNLMVFLMDLLLESVKLFVGLPLDTVSDYNNVNHLKAITAGLKALKLLGVEGIELPIFWGVVEKEAAGKYKWSRYLAVAETHHWTLRIIGLT